MTQHLRTDGSPARVDLPTLFSYEREGGLLRSVELCNGSGACRKQQGGTMCPSFRGTCDEKDSTRGRANALRLALSDTRPLQALREHWVRDVLDLCLMCKACKSECPSNVDMARLKAEFLNLYYDHRRRPIGHLLMASIHRINELGSLAAPLVNLVQENPVARWMMEHLAGFDRRRSLPRLYFNNFRRWFARHHPASGVGRTGRVLLLDDCFTTFNEPDVGKAAVAVLESAGYRVERAGLTCCGRAMISKGMLREARSLIRAQVPKLARRLAEGVPILGLEPSCLLTLVDEWPELVPSPEARIIAEQAHLAEGWIAQQLRAGTCSLELESLDAVCVFHGHCHQKALRRAGGSVEALRLVPGLEVKVLDAGCCGMAGSFGFEKEHFDLSTRIAGLELLPALSAAPGALVSATGTSCRHQVLDLDGRRALHPVEVLASQLV